MHDHHRLPSFTSSIPSLPTVLLHAEPKWSSFQKLDWCCCGCCCGCFYLHHTWMNMRRVFNFLNKRQAHRAERLLPRAATFFFLLFFSFSKGSKEAACQLTTDRHNSHAITFDLRPSVHSFKKETAKVTSRLLSRTAPGHARPRCKPQAATTPFPLLLRIFVF